MTSSSPSNYVDEIDSQVRSLFKILELYSDGMGKQYKGEQSAHKFFRLAIRILSPLSVLFSLIGLILSSYELGHGTASILDFITSVLASLISVALLCVALEISNGNYLRRAINFITVREEIESIHLLYYTEWRGLLNDIPTHERHEEIESFIKRLAEEKTSICRKAHAAGLATEAS